MDSDTESEGEYAMPTSTTSDAQFVLRQPQTTSDLSVSDAINILAVTASRASSLGSDAELHANVVAASSSLNSFLDDMLQADATEKQDICASFDTLISLLDGEFLVALFHHRKAVYTLLRALGDTSSISVPWTDILLLKLCRFIALISSGRTQTAAPTQLQDAQALWAVRQLPQDLKNLTASVYSSYASPGMRKLALQLVFGACVVRPSMTGDQEPQCIPLSALDIEGIARFYGDMAVRRAGGLGDDEKLSCAMAAALCTTFAMRQSSDNPSPTSRPYFTSLVFGLIHALVDTDRLDVFENDPLDSAQLLLLSWGEVIPWCWRSCTDPRSADMPLVSLLTTSWLRHQDQRVVDDSWASATLALLMRDLSLSATHILQLLYRVSDALQGDQGHIESIARLAHKVCWSIAQLSDPLLEGHFVFFPDAVLHLCTIFLHYASGGAAAMVVAESALQAFLHAQPSDVCVVAERLAEEHEFPSMFDRAVTCMRKSLAQPTVDGAGVRLAQLLLAFVTIFGHRGARLPCYKSSITMLGSAASDYVCVALESSRYLATSLAIATPYLGVGGRTLSEDEILCLLYPEQAYNMNASPALDLLCATAVSDYILSGITALQAMSALLKAEVWDALRDALILAIQRRFVGEDEALAVLVAPMIGRALSQMKTCNDAVFVEHATQSSWTSSLCSQIDGLVKSGNAAQEDHVRAALRERLAPFGHTIVNLTMESCDTLHNHDEGANPSCATQLIFHSSANFVCLIPVPLAT